MTAWTYQPLPLTGVTLSDARSGNGGFNETVQVFALRLSPTGLAEAMDGEGQWHRVGKKTTYTWSLSDGTSHSEVRVSELEAKPIYYHNGDS
jgi:hypothetical protein